MSLDSLNKWLSLGASLGVLAGILFLGFELQQTQSSLRSEAYQLRSFQAYDFHWNMSERPGVNILFWDIVDDPSKIESLTTEERSVITSIARMTMIDADNEHYQYQNGFLDEGFFQTITLTDIQAFAPVWRKLGVEENRPDFRDVVDNVLNGAITPLN